MQVGIVGLGLIGGSMGIALKALPEVRGVVGFNQSTRHATEALALGLVDECVDFGQIKQCDVILLAIPVGGIIEILGDLVDVAPHVTIIDLGSTKGTIVQAIPPAIRQNFVAAHPMSGTEKFGPHAAVEGLFREKIVVLCDLHESGAAQVQVAKTLFKGMGMHIVSMDAREHDLHAAYISHLPHAISYSLANSVLAQEDPESILLLAAGGFRDMSRIAKSSPTMWVEIFRQNRQNVLDSMSHFESEIKTCKQMVENEEWEALRAWMTRAVKLHDIL